MAEGYVRGELATPTGTVRWPDVFSTDDRGKYGLMLVVKKSAMATPEGKAIVDALNQAAKEKFGVESYKEPYKNKALKHPFKTSDDYEFLEEDEVGFRLKSKFKPQVYDFDCKTLLDCEDDFYNGVEGRCVYTAAAYDVEGNRGVQLQLELIQKTGVGTRGAGSRAKADAYFTPVEAPEPVATSADNGGDDDVAF